MLEEPAVVESPSDHGAVLVGEAPATFEQAPDQVVAAPLPVSADRRQRRRPSALPMVLMLLVGLLVGFIAGYMTGINTPLPEDAVPPVRQSKRSGDAQPGTPIGAPRETAPSRPAPAQPPAGTSPVPSRDAAGSRPAPVPAGSLRVRSTPSGARVSVNGTNRGTTPLTVRDLPLGTYRIQVTRDGYEPNEQDVQLSRGRPSPAVTVRLRRSGPAEFTGSLVVESLPAGAAVFVDGRLAGKTPVTIARVPAGSHVVRLEMVGYRRWSTSVQVVTGESARVSGSLERESLR
jgi:hypothetical protein